MNCGRRVTSTEHGTHSERSDLLCGECGAAAAAAAAARLWRLQRPPARIILK